ncbi:hypothetical protein [Amycolatopsis sp. H20-H5]|nr:hypothetical protein [Amycolatopsis sp. H20-H5]MEC3981012.1 hypothetical protein [Amycolatopsis sp. H20-H5]
MKTAEGDWQAAGKAAVWAASATRPSLDDFTEQKQITPNYT